LGTKYQFHTATARKSYEDLLNQLRETKQTRKEGRDEIKR